MSFIAMTCVSTINSYNVRPDIRLSVTQNFIVVNNQNTLFILINHIAGRGQGKWELGMNIIIFL